MVYDPMAMECIRLSRIIIVDKCHSQDDHYHFHFHNDNTVLKPCDAWIPHWDLRARKALRQRFAPWGNGSKENRAPGRLSALARAENGPLEQFTLVDWFVFGQSTMDVLLMVRQVNTVSSVLISSTLDMDV